MSDDMRIAIVVICGMAVMFLVSRHVERRWPIDPNLPRSEVIDDWKATGTNLLLSWLAGPLTAACSAAIVTAAGGGLIHLRTDGWWYGVSAVGFILVADFYRYATHRLYHVIPCLWALHSFHHSAEALTFVTGARHHWLEKVLEGAFFPIIPILFSIPPEILIISGAIYFLPDGCAHLNVRFRLGRFVTWLNNPQFHRIHHSTQPEHLNKNFASLLPLWDILFGTAWVPRADEYPPTGLVPGEKVGIMTSIVWPFRRYLPQLQGYVPVWPRVENWEGMRKIYMRLSGSHDS
jgi:sterol desaturase/sphingolipid hydroxylase (fatty acid hydroxylase superfamily)